jgi:glycosyltransferase involved in cell wall biosynthesis
MTQRKVIIIGSAYPLRGGGISTFNERLAHAFIEKGDDCIIYSFSLQYPSFLFPGTSQYTNEPEPEGLNIKTEINSINPLNWLWVGFKIVREKPDLVIIRFWIPFMSPCLGTIARIIRKKKVRVVAIVDNIIPHDRKPFDKFLSNYFVKSVTHFITMSKNVLKDLHDFDKIKPKKVTFHPLYDNFGQAIPRSKAIERLNLDGSFKYLLFFGFIREYKGLDLLLQSFSDVRLRKLPIRLLVVGEFYVNPQPYLEMVEDLKISDSVIVFNKFIPNAEVVNYFCASNLVVQPYKEATQSGITQIAYHFNKPMITTNVGGLSEIVINNKVGFVVEPNAGEIANAIYDYFENNLEIPFTENVKIEKIKFSWENFIKELETI